MQDNPVSDKWAQRLIDLWKWKEGFRGDNVRKVGDSVYVGSGQSGNGGINTDWRPRQFRVVSEENDYLVCVPYNLQDDTVGEVEYKVAKAPDLRGGTVRRGAYPNYVPEETVIWAAALRANGVEDDEGNKIILMEVNYDGRSSAWFIAEVTASSSSSSDHTIVEVGPGLSPLPDGRTATDAKAINGRNGVPTGTKVFVLEVKAATAGGVPEYYFTILDGDPGTPKDLDASGTAADTTTFDISEQGSSRGAQASLSRFARSIEALFLYFRTVTTDASGDITDVSAEVETFIAGDAADSPKSDHITLENLTDSGADGKIIKLNQPQATAWTRKLVLRPGTNITLDGSTADVEFPLGNDDGGRNTDGPADSDVTVTIAASGTGGTNNDGVTTVKDDTTTVTQQNDGVIDFVDTSNSGTTLGVDFTVTDNGGEADVTATVDASGLTSDDTGSVAGSGHEIFTFLVEIPNGATTPATTTLDSSDWSARTGTYGIGAATNATAATWNATTVAASSSAVGFKTSNDGSTDTTLSGALLGQFFVDASDSNKLKFTATSAPASPGDSAWNQITITRGPRKTSADYTFP